MPDAWDEIADKLAPQTYDERDGFRCEAKPHEIAAALRAAYDKGRADTKEECAQICDAHTGLYHPQDIARAIRERK